MRKITIAQAKKLIAAGTIEFVTDMKIGYCQIRHNATGKVSWVEIIL